MEQKQEARKQRRAHQRENDSKKAPDTVELGTGGKNSHQKHKK